MPKKIAYILILGICCSVLVSSTQAATQSTQPGINPNLPAGTSSLYGPQIHLCCNSEVHQRYPSVAYNTLLNYYLIVNHGEKTGIRSINGSTVQPGIGLEWVFLISGTGDYDCCLHPDAVFNWTDNKFLVVWQQYNDTSSRWEIYGAWIPGSLPPSPSTAFKIADYAGHHLKYPKIAWNSFRNEFMVVWQAETTAGALASIGFRRMASNGTFPAPAGFIRQVNSPANPDVTYNLAADQYLAVWSEVTPHPNYIDVYGARLDYQGAIQGGIFAVRQKSGEQQLAAVTTNEQDRYMVVWQDDYWGEWDIYGQFLDINGNQIGDQLWIATSTSNETNPEIVANGGCNQYVVVYQRTNLDGEGIQARLLSGSTITPEVIEVSPGGLGENHNPAVGTHRSGYLFAYHWASWEPNSVEDMYARFWSPYGLFLPAVYKHP